MSDVIFGGSFFFALCSRNELISDEIGSLALCQTKNEWGVPALTIENKITKLNGHMFVTVYITYLFALGKIFSKRTR